MNGGERGSAKHEAVGLRDVGIYCATAPTASESAKQICEMALCECYSDMNNGVRSTNRSVYTVHCAEKTNTQSVE